MPVGQEFVAPSSQFDALRRSLVAAPKRWCVTGAAGFIGSSLVEALLQRNQEVVGLDNYATGSPSNIAAVVPADAVDRFHMIVGDIRDIGTCRQACAGSNYVLHQAALGSVPRSIEDPVMSNQVNVDGFLNMLVAAKDAKVERFVFASSSSVYGDSTILPQVEDRTGRVLSPYAVTKATNEAYATVFQRAFDLQVIGLRYFNVFGPRQDPNGPYAAVIPRWISNLLAGRACTIYGDGETSRDFCYVANAVQANLLAATADAHATQECYNIACGETTSLTQLFFLIRQMLATRHAEVSNAEPHYEAFRHGDIRHSYATIEKAQSRLGYVPTHRIRQGLEETLRWYSGTLRSNAT